MDRFQPIAITNSSLGAHLLPSEEVYLLTTNVGLYSGPYKSLPHSSGTVYLTSHRLFYIDDAKPHSHSCFLTLDHIRETQHYAGFLKSSPKVTLGFHKTDESGDANPLTAKRSAGPRKDSGTSTGNGDWRGVTVGVEESGEADGHATKTWICRICAFSNPVEATTSAGQAQTVKCQLCGVTSERKDLVVEEATKVSRSPAAPPQPADTPSARDGISCPACTFANHPSMARCEICDTSLGTVDTSRLKRTDERPNGVPVQAAVEKEDEGERHDSIRLSFRKGGDKAFYLTLKTTLKGKGWLKKSSALGDNRSSGNRFSSVHRNIDGRSASSALAGEEGAEVGATKRVGIEGIFSAVDLQAREESDDMRDAFRDLEALMARAKKMVDLAETLNAKLTRQEAAAGRGPADAGQRGNDEAANVIRSSLVRLGLPTPAITLDMAKDEMEYNLQLAQELAGLLYTGTSPLMGPGRVLHKPGLRQQGSHEAALTPATETVVRFGGRGIMPLDELWCMWNRARGVALVSPQTLLAVCDILPTITLPQIDCKRFRSGLSVLHTSKYQLSRFSQRVLAKLAEGNEQFSSSGAAALDIAKSEDCPLHLVNELLEEVEYEMGTIVRDEHGQDSWHINHITHFNWDQWLNNRVTATN